MLKTIMLFLHSLCKLQISKVLHITKFTRKKEIIHILIAKKIFRKFRTVKLTTQIQSFFVDFYFLFDIAV